MTLRQDAEQFMADMGDDTPLAERQRLYAMLSLETTLWEQGFCRIAGVDEAGRGPLAGPIVAAAVVLREPIAGLNDSKRLTDAARRALYERLNSGKHLVGMAAVSSAEIDATGIQSANYAAMRNAIAVLREKPDFILVDGYSLPGITQPSMRVIKGDSRSLSIAAASIVAKVTRDTMLLEMDKRYPQYGFARNKGYGTVEHLEALRRFGPCKEHRKSFAPCRAEGDSKELF